MANLLALLITAVANTAANRRFTFGIRGAADAARHHFQGLLVFGIGLALTSGALRPASTARPAARPDRWLELVTVTAANLPPPLLKFLLFRLVVFRPARPAAPHPAPLHAAPSPAMTPPSPAQKRPSK